MQFFKKIPAWLVGGILGLIYFFVIYFLDFGLCEFGVSKCSDVAGLPTMIFNFPAVMILRFFIPGFDNLGQTLNFIGIAIMDFILVSIVVFLIGRIINFTRKLFFLI